MDPSYPNGYFFLQSKSIADNGVYQVTVSVQITGQKSTLTDYWDFSTAVQDNTDYAATITFADPCETTLLNQPADSSFLRTPADMATSQLATPVS